MQLTIRELIEAGAHFGHLSRFWNPSMAPYIYGVKQKLHIIDLVQTQSHAMLALNYARSVIERKGVIAYVGTKPSAQAIIRDEALRAGMPYVCKRWPGGLLTNYKTIRKSVKRLIEMEAKFSEINDNPESFGLTKRERLSFERKIRKLEYSFGGLKHMNNLPDALFIIDVNQEKIAVKEANKLGIPVIGIVDTNSSPDGIDYMVPGNDDAISAIKLYTKYITDMIVNAKQKQAEGRENEKGERSTTKVVKAGKTVVRTVIRQATGAGDVKSKPAVAPIEKEKTVEASKAETKSTPSTPTPAKVADAKPTAKAAEKPAEAKVAEAKVAEAKPAVAKPAAKATAKAAEKPAEVKAAKKPAAKATAKPAAKSKKAKAEE